jgi:hypothetical protein
MVHRIALAEEEEEERGRCERWRKGGREERAKSPCAGSGGGREEDAL